MIDDVPNWVVQLAVALIILGAPAVAGYLGILAYWAVLWLATRSARNPGSTHDHTA